MTQMMITRRDLPAENASLREQAAELRSENQRLQQENRELRATLDAHVTRARSTGMFGPLELTAGTCVGPRRRRG